MGNDKKKKKVCIIDTEVQFTSSGRESVAREYDSSTPGIFDGTVTNADVIGRCFFNFFFFFHVVRILKMIICLYPYTRHDGIKNPLKSCLQYAF